MQGGGRTLSERLPRLASLPIGRDVDQVMRWVARSRVPERRYQWWTGFGGVPGVRAARYHAAPFDHMFFARPALTLHSAEETAYAEPRGLCQEQGAPRETSANSGE